MSTSPLPSSEESTPDSGQSVIAPSLIEHFFLEGPQPRRRESWMVVRIVREFLTAFRALHFIGPCVTVQVMTARRVGDVTRLPAGM